MNRLQLFKDYHMTFADRESADKDEYKADQIVQCVKVIPQSW